MIFNFRAKTIDGQEIAGEHDAVDRFALARDLRSEGLTVISAMEKTNKVGWRVNPLEYSELFHRVKLKDKIIFASNLGSMLGAGLALGRALTVLARQTNHRYFSRVIVDLGDRINKGENLSQALAAHPKVFPEVLVAMVEAAEESGKLPEALKLVAEQLEKTYSLERKVLGALIYPAVIVVAIIVIAILMMIFLIPTLSATFRDLKVPLPWTTQVIINLSDFMVNNLALVVGGLVILVLALVAFSRSIIGKRFFDYLILRLPLFADLTRESNSATVLRSASSLISAGVSMTKTLEITARVVQNHYYRAVLLEALDKIQRGLPLSTVLAAHQNLFPIFASEMVAVGEETGRLAELLLKGAEFFEEEVNQVTKNLSTVIEPALMILIGLAVGFFAVSMIGPMYSLSDAIK